MGLKLMPAVLVGLTLLFTHVVHADNQGCTYPLTMKGLVNCPCKLVTYEDKTVYFAESGYYSYVCNDKSLFPQIKQHLQDLEQQNNGKNGWHVDFSGFREKYDDKHSYTCYRCTKLSNSNLQDSDKQLDCAPYTCDLTGYEKAMAEYKAKKPTGTNQGTTDDPAGARQ